MPTSPGSLGDGERHSLPDANVATVLGRYGQDPAHAEQIIEYGFHSVLAVPLHARGVVLGLVNFWRSENPAPFDADDEVFARELAARAAVCVDNARRYTREHQTAVTLQRSLLPSGLPEQDALDIAHRYVPAEAGVGGDWFDVIALPGTRVALVVGDVVGHGLHAAATMGRLRTAVQNFAALDLPAGSRLVLYTDGLVETRGRDIDEGMELLCRSLARAGRTPEETCADVLATLPSRPSDDDVALLVAGTRVLDPSRVSAWDVERDPAAVSRIRREVTDRLAEWGLDEEAFVTELILSELLTNAVRYGTDPVRVRLLHDRSLICEVSDGSSTAPHLRYAATTDEGGRGLFLVAQPADRWGTRYTETGKVIWSEQTRR